MLIEKMTEKFNPQAAEGLSAIYCFQIEGQKDYLLKIANGKFEVLEQVNEKPNVTFKADQKTWESIISGAIPAQMAFMTGKLNVNGDLPLALKLASVFSLT